MSKTTAHIRYKLPDGTKVPGTTTVLNILAKPALIKWANNLGLKGIDSTKYIDDKADIGTCAHYHIQCHLIGEKPDLNDYSPATISLAENSFLKFLEWAKDKKITDAKCEIPLVSTQYKYGGTVDIYADINGKKTLIDIKTSGSGIWPEMKYQVMAYKQLLQENNMPVDEVFILRVGRSEDEGFEFQKVENFEQSFKMFQLCLQIYNLQKEME